MGQNASKTGPRAGELAFRVVRYDGQEVPGDELVMQRACRTGEPVLNDSYRIVHPDGMAAIVYGLVTQVGGTVRLDSAPGVGTTATVLLPLIPVEELDREVEPNRWAGPDRAGGFWWSKTIRRCAGWRWTRWSTRGLWSRAPGLAG